MFVSKSAGKKKKGRERERERDSSLLTASLPFFHRRNEIERDKVYLYLWPSSPSSVETVAALGVLRNTLLLRMEVALRDPRILPSG